MSPHDTSIAIQRVLLALDARRNAADAIDAAIQLAARHGTSVHACYVEDEDLLRLAALPFAREASVLSPAGRELLPQQIQARWLRDAQRTQLTLAKAAAQAGVGLAFQVMRGHLLDCVLTLRKAGDLVIVSEPVKNGAPSRGRDVQRWLIVGETAASAARGIAVAAHFMNQTGEVLVWVQAVLDAPLLHDLTQPLRTRQIVRAMPPSAGELQLAMSELRPGTLIMSAEFAATARPTLIRSLQAAACRWVLGP